MDIEVKRQKDGSYIATVKGDKRKPRLKARGQTFQQAAFDLLKTLAVAQGDSERDNRDDV